jgi:hypothetical protein
MNTSDEIKAAAEMPGVCTEAKLLLDLAAAKAEIEELKAKNSALQVEVERATERALQRLTAETEFPTKEFLQWEIKAARKAMEVKDELLKQVMDWHSDPGSLTYNQCDTDPCNWCTLAQATFDAATKGEQP